VSTPPVLGGARPAADPGEHAGGQSAGAEHAGEVVADRLGWRPYGRREPVLAEVSLRIPAGERVLLAGPSGSGKSTLLRALAGVLEATGAGELTGTVTVDGRAPGSRPGQVGLVLQEPGAGVVAATVGRDVAFGLENVAVPRAAMAPVVAEALAAVGLDLPPDRRTRALSGGETQRLALAGALALRPSVLLLDEPTAMLDPDHARQVRDTVSAVCGASRLTTVVVEHTLGPWVDHVDRLVVLDGRGRLVADGPVARVLAEERGRLLDLGIWVPGAPPPVPLPVPPGLLARSGVHGPEDGAAGPGGGALVASGLRVDRRVTATDGTSRDVPAVDVAEPLVASPGTSTAVVGPSGSGKSTLLLALAGLVEPTRGAVTVRGGEARGGRADTAYPPVAGLASTDLARVVAWVPQWSNATIIGRTVLDEVLVTSRALRDAGAEERAGRLLDLLGLGTLEGADPRELSGGEQRRLALAAALVHRPDVLLADEPTVGQDRHTWAAVAGLVEAHRAAGGAAVLATHDPALVARADAVRPLAAPPRPAEPPARRRPLLARCGPLSLLAAAALAVPTGVLAPGWRAALVVLAVQVLLAVVGLSAPRPGVRPAGRARRVVTRLLPGLVAAASVGWSTWLLGGPDLEVAAGAALRVVLIVLPSAVVLPFVDPDALGDHLGQRLRLPPRPVVALAAALQRVQTFGETWTELARARRVRGLGPRTRSPRTVLAHVGALTTGLLVRSLRLAADLATAMDARGFATAHRRTWSAPAPWRPADWAVVVLGALPLAVAAVLAAMPHA
jgi:energy-coupling factor transport system ATP-binding protein